MTRAAIVALQKRIGTEPDGFWGPRSIAACQRHLRRMMPCPHPFPAASQAALRKTYGAPGDESALILLEVADLGVRFEGRPVRAIRCHRLVAASLRRALEAVRRVAPWLLERYAGAFCHRNIRGGTTPSLHAWGAAIDLDPSANGNTTHWPTRATMPIAVMEAFAREGWLPAGAFWGRDAMHFQATR